MTHLSRPIWATLALSVTLILSTLSVTAPATAAPADPSPIKIATGPNHTVVVRADGIPYAAGMNFYGQITGSGSSRTLRRMTGLPSAVRAVDVSTNGGHTLVLGSNGIVYGTGRNAYGQLTGLGDRSTLAPLDGLPSGTRALAIAAGYEFSLVIADDGHVYGAGRNLQNQLTGTGDRYFLTPMTGLPAGVRATAIAVGLFHSLVLGSNGVLYGTGGNSQNQLTTGGNRSTLTALSGMPPGVDPTAIAAGAAHSLFIGSDGRVYGTGRGDEGQLTGTLDRTVFTPLTGLPAGAHATKISSGSYFSLVLSSHGIAYGTGENPYGQLTGTGHRTALAAMAPAGSGGRVTQIAGGESGSLIRTADGVVHGMGHNGTGQLTGESVANVLLPRPLTGQVIAAVGRPALLGSAKVGGTMRVTTGTWGPAPTALTYQWFRSGSPISGARAVTYRPRKADGGKRLTVTVTARRAGLVTGSATTERSASVLRAPLRYVARKKPVVHGTPKVGRLLRVKRLTRAGWSPDAKSHTYQWYRSGKKIAGATKSTYRVKRADRGKKIVVRITGKRSGYQPGRVTTKKTATIRLR